MKVGGDLMNIPLISVSYIFTCVFRYVLYPTRSSKDHRSLHSLHRSKQEIKCKTNEQYNIVA